MDFTKRVKGKILRMGFTTGSCATAAAKAAASQLLLDRELSAISIRTPQNIELTLQINTIDKSSNGVTASVIKDAGDDPDITNGVEIFATVSKIPDGITLVGGEGIGVVTKAGLDQPVGEAAINSGPRKMLKNALKEVAEEAGYTGGFHVTISIPAGVHLAQKTFNPRLGIEGGISVIGTTGIVEPMSNQALIDTIVLEIRQLAARGVKEVILISGNYSKDFLQNILGLGSDKIVVCSNFVRDSVEAALAEGFSDILLVGHIGKFVKLGIGMPNTHSDNGDGRMETLITCALKAGASCDLLLEIADCVTTDAALFILQRVGLLDLTMKELGQAIQYHLERILPEKTSLGFLFFTNKEGLPGELFRSEAAEKFLRSKRG